MKLKGTIEIKGKPINWQRNPATGGCFVMFGTLEQIHVDVQDVEKSPDLVRIAIEAYYQGVGAGMDRGRAELQNALRGLLGVRGQ